MDLGTKTFSDNFMTNYYLISKLLKIHFKPIKNMSACTDEKIERGKSQSKAKSISSCPPTPGYTCPPTPGTCPTTPGPTSPTPTGTKLISQNNDLNLFFKELYEIYLN